MEQSDKYNAQLLTSGKRFSSQLLAGDPNPGMTLALQMNLKMAQAASQGGGKGMSHATASTNPFSKSKGFESINLATQGQETESGSPGRREGSHSTLGLK